MVYKVHTNSSCYAQPRQNKEERSRNIQLNCKIVKIHCIITRKDKELARRRLWTLDTNFIVKSALSNAFSWQKGWSPESTWTAEKLASCPHGQKNIEIRRGNRSGIDVHHSKEYYRLTAINESYHERTVKK